MKGDIISRFIVLSLMLILALLILLKLITVSDPAYVLGFAFNYSRTSAFLRAPLLIVLTYSIVLFVTIENILQYFRKRRQKNE